MVSQLSGDELVTKGNCSQFQTRPLFHMLRIKIHVSNKISRCIERHCDMPGLKVDFLKGHGLSYLHGLLPNTEIKGILKRKEHRSLEVLFLFLADSTY